MIGTHTTARLVCLPSSTLMCNVTYSVTDRMGGQYGCGQTVVDLISIKTPSGINLLDKVPATERLILEMGLYEREARKVFDETQPKKEGTEQC
ncbi:hypothetical protein [Neptunomonas japonica]|uniref:hypothetical protein n=1 Tax=Neptunomonas japonica TaxID=417574 RepID=UPI00040EF190|nr:hypothetical protein [Neptunomonas japonica]